MAVMLQAGLDGIRHKMPLPEPLEETLMQGAPGRMRQIKVLPNSLAEALDALSDDDVILSALVPMSATVNIAAKRQGIRRIQPARSPIGKSALSQPLLRIMAWMRLSASLELACGSATLRLQLDAPRASP